MSKEYLKKEEAKIVIWDIESGDDAIPILITHKEFGGNYYGKWFDFQPELDELEISECFDDWVYWGNKNRIELLEELESRGFEVVLGENY